MILVSTALFNLAGNVEGDLTTILASLRDLFFGFGAIAFIAATIQLIRRHANLIMRNVKPQACNHSSP